MDEMESTADEGNESISSNITYKDKKNDSQVINNNNNNNNNRIARKITFLKEEIKSDTSNENNIPTIIRNDNNNNSMQQGQQQQHHQEYDNNKGYDSNSTKNNKVNTEWMSRMALQEGGKYDKDYYENLVSLVQDFLNSKEYEEFNPQIIRVLSTKECAQVDVDLNRSFGNMLKDSNTGQKRGDMREVLLAYAVHNRSIGYVQGMNFLTALCLEYLTKKETFWFLNILTTKLPSNFFKKAGMEECLIFQHIVRKYAPEIEIYMGSSYETVLNLFVFQWMLPLFVHAMQPDVTILAWKHLLSGINKKKSSDHTNNNYKVTYRLHEMSLRLLLHYGKILIEEEKTKSNTTTKERSNDILLDSGITFVRSIKDKVIQLNSQDNNGTFPWKDESLPKIDKHWFRSIHENYVLKVRRAELNVIQSRKTTIDMQFLNSKRLDNLHYELIDDVADVEISINNGTNGNEEEKSNNSQLDSPERKIKLASSFSTKLNLVQFQELFVKATVHAFNEDNDNNNPNNEINRNYKNNNSNVQCMPNPQLEIAHSFASHLFSVVDRGSKSVLSNKELLCSCILVSTLSGEQKLNTCFLMYARYSTELGYNVVDKEMALSIYATLLKLSEDWYGIPASVHLVRDRVDSGIVRSLFHMDETDCLSLIEFKQVMRVHTSVMICIEKPINSIYEKEEEEMVGAFDNFLSRVGCTGWSRKEYDAAYSTPQRVRKPPREYSPSTFPSPANEKALNVDILNLNDIKRDNNNEKVGGSSVGDDMNASDLPTLKSIKSLKNPSSPQQKRGSCSGTALEGSCPLM